MINNTRKLAVIAAILAASIALAACTKTRQFAAVNTDSSTVALRGFDAVAYFVSENAIEGNPTYEFVWNGAKWYFASAENMERFKSNPEQYAPQYGGYCSYAVSKGYTADGDPQAWAIVEGKLYLNYSPKVKEKWMKERDSNIEKAVANWTGFNANPPEHK